jgi:hypothetical protein
MSSKRISWSALVALTAFFTVSAMATAFADNTVGDGDDTTPVAANPLPFGTVCINSTTDDHALVAISRNGGGVNVFKDGIIVTVSVLSVSGTGLSASMDSTTITLPSNWASLANNVMSSAVSSKVSLVAGGSAAAFSGSVTYRATGLNGSNATITRDGLMPVTATISNTGACAPAPTDTTSPSVTVSFPSPTAGSNGWFNADDVLPVQGTVSASDASNVTNISCTGATLGSVTGYGSNTASGTLTVSGDGTHNVSCTATDGASPPNTGAASGSSNTANVKIDATAPSINDNGFASGTAGSNGWYTSDVTEDFSASDATSGLADCAASFTQTSSSQGTSEKISSGPCSDKAGNTNPGIDSGAYKIDKTGPSANLSVTAGTLGAHGWYTSNVTVHTSGADSISGPVTCSDDQSQTMDTAGHTFDGSCTNDAGLSTDATSLTVKLDKTGPSAGLSVTAGTLGTNGWYTSDVTVHTSGADSLSSPVTCDGDQYQTTETTGVVFNGSCTNDAGLTTNAVSLTVKLDKTNPTVSLVGGPADGAGYYFGSVPGVPTCSASDALSGLNGSCSVAGYSALVGGHTVSATATDNAGRTATASRTYTVNPWTLSGFYQPVDMNSVYNTVKGGSTVPLKFEAFAGSAELTDTSQVQSLSAVKITCTGGPTDDIEVLSPTGGTSLRYDTVAGQFIYNWQTPKPAGICYRVTMTTQDLTTLVALFKTK